MHFEIVRQHHIKIYYQLWRVEMFWFHATEFIEITTSEFCDTADKFESDNEMIYLTCYKKYVYIYMGVHMK